MSLTLSTSVVGLADLNRLLRELNSLEDFFVGVASRQPGSSMTAPKTTQLLDEMARLNKLNLAQAEDRAKLAKALNDLLAKAPKLQISFAVDPSPKVVETILAWMRQNLHPAILLQVGLQPNIGAGCVLRTPNREFDMSMRQHLLDSRDYLVQLVDQSAKAAAIKIPVTAGAAPVPAQASPQQPARSQPAAAKPPTGVTQ